MGRQRARRHDNRPEERPDDRPDDGTGLHAHLKTLARPWVEARHASPVVRGIFEGTLDEAVMRRWIEQDFHYLFAYSRFLARLAVLAPERHLMTLIDGAHYTAHTEIGRLHELAALFDADVSGREVGAACRDYIDYLAENAAVFETGVVAVLPCMVGFAALGLSVDLPEEPRYRKWVEIYAASDFQGYSTRFAEVVDDLDIERRVAETVFERGMLLEQALWDDAAQAGGMTSYG